MLKNPIPVRRQMLAAALGAEVEPLQIVDIESPKPWITVTHTKSSAPIPAVGRAGQNQFRIDVTVGPDAPAGRIAETILVITNSKHQPEHTVTISGAMRLPLPDISSRKPRC